MNEYTFKNFRIDQGSAGVLTATLDVPDRAMNVFDESVMTELHSLVERLETDKTVRAVIFRGGKESGFLAGADVTRVQTIKTPQVAEELSGAGQAVFAQLERLPIPTIAVIHGQCLGGGLEFALACRYRIACDDAHTRLGFPEVELGILPGWGGTQRLPRLIGLAPSLNMILETKKVSARAALRMGLVDLAPTPDRFDIDVQQFVAKITAGQMPQRRRQGLVATLRDRTALGQWIVLRTARAKLKSHAEHYPALPTALAVIEKGLQQPGEEGYRAERKAFAELLFTPTCRSLIGLFFARERARKSETWTKSAAVANPKGSDSALKLGVIGGGVMGAGIAQLAAFQGFDVVVKEINADLLAAGMGRIQKLIDDAVRKGAISAAEAATRTQAIQPTVDWDPIAGVDIAIEAVTENEKVKLQVFRELDQRLSPQALLASNTSALSIEHLAEATRRPGQVAGLHFFNPVHRMQLVEVVRAPETNDPTVGQLVEVVRRLGKIPVVVADSPGFLVNRILFPYLAEAVRMNCEGFSTEEIDGELRRFGMPLGPLELLDQVGLDVAADVAKNLAAQSTASNPTAKRLAEMVERGWLGKKSGQGFYHYEKGRRGKPTATESDAGAKTHTRPPPAAVIAGPAGLLPIQQRLVCLLINEAARCLGEHIVEEPWMVDLALVFGTGFAPFRGGPLRVADNWGIASVVQQLESLQRTFGENFTPCERLREMAANRDTFYRGET